MKSLVEERDEPKLQQAESIDVESPRTTPTDRKKELPETEEEEDAMDDEATKAELEKISEASRKFLSETGGPPPPPKKNTYRDPYANAPEMKVASQKGLVGVIGEISEKEKPVEGKSETDSKENGSQISLDLLAQLDDLEAEIMNVLDDTNSFDPSSVVVVSPPKLLPPGPLPVTKPPKPPPSQDETDSAYTRKSKTLPMARSGSSSKEPSPAPLRGERKGSAKSRRSSSDSSEPSPSPRRNTVSSTSPARKRVTNVK